MNRFLRPSLSLMMALSLFTFSACSDENEILKTTTPPPAKPVEDDSDTDEPADETPKNETPGQDPSDTPHDTPEDEVSGTSTLARSYETSGGQWKSYRRYEYFPDGRVSKVLWTTHTPMERTGSYTYTYNGEAIDKITTEYGDENTFLWKNGRIERSENHRQGVLKDYTLYAYDDAGNVGSTEIYYRQPSGEYLLGFRFVYLYFTDGNLYKKLTYAPAQDQGEDVLLTTETYEGYSSAPNPFPMVTLLPNVATQKNLPSSYRYEGNGKDLHYSLSYEFREDGYPLNRTVTGVGASETTTYKYY